MYEESMIVGLRKGRSQNAVSGIRFGAGRKMVMKLYLEEQIIFPGLTFTSIGIVQKA